MHFHTSPIHNNRYQMKYQMLEAAVALVLIRYQNGFIADFQPLIRKSYSVQSLYFKSLKLN